MSPVCRHASMCVTYCYRIRQMYASLYLPVTSNVPPLRFTTPRSVLDTSRRQGHWLAKSFQLKFSHCDIFNKPVNLTGGTVRRS